MGGLIWPVRVYYEDTDAGGVVYYANYLKFMERARTEWLRSLGIEQDRLRDEDGLLFVIAEVHVRYHKPARFNDLLQVSVVPAGLGRCRFMVEQEVRRGDDLLASGMVTAACVDAVSFKPKPIPRGVP